MYQDSYKVARTILAYHNQKVTEDILDTKSEEKGYLDNQALFAAYNNNIDLSSLNLTELQLKIIKRCENIRTELVGSKFMPGINSNITNFLQNYYQKLLLNSNEETQLVEAIFITIRNLLLPTHYISYYGNEQIIAISLIYIPQIKAAIDDELEFAKIMQQIINEVLLARVRRKTKSTENKKKQFIATKKQDIVKKPSKRELQESKAPTIQKASSSPSQESNQHEFISKATNSIYINSIIASPSQVQQYKIYTTEFDQTILANKLTTHQELLNLRNQLNLKMKDLKKTALKSALKLQLKLQTKQLRNHFINNEDGILDSKKLSNIVTNPLKLNYFKQINKHLTNHTIVTLLIDNSGSMRGKPIAIAAICAEIISKILERCSIKTEILGFTTRHWKGGESYKKWQKEGAPTNPGRLNDLRHIIYKSSSISWHSAKLNLGVMLKDGLLKENIDGEALAWAYTRIIKKPEPRKLLIIISDGAPVDDCTISSNQKSLLDNHLKDTIKHIESNKKIELIAIGVGHDVNRYYSDAINIKTIDELNDTLLQKLTEVIS